MREFGTSFVNDPYSEDDDGRAHQHEEGHDGVQEAARAGGHLQGAGEGPVRLVELGRRSSTILKENQNNPSDKICLKSVLALVTRAAGWKPCVIGYVSLYKAEKVVSFNPWLQLHILVLLIS